LRRFPLYIFAPQLFAALGLVRESRPGSFGPAATLAHMVERCRFRLNPRLFSAGEEELQV
jgi:hypothetical protein